MAPPAVTLANPAEHGPGSVVVNGRIINQERWRKALHDIKRETVRFFLQATGNDEEAGQLLAKQAGPINDRPLFHDDRAQGGSLLDGPGNFKDIDLSAMVNRIVDCHFYLTDPSVRLPDSCLMLTACILARIT